MGIGASRFGWLLGALRWEGRREGISADLMSGEGVGQRERENGDVHGCECGCGLPFLHLPGGRRNICLIFYNF